MDESGNSLYYFDILKTSTKMTASSIPQFALYGESTPGAAAELLHVELIETRSRQYDWHIADHTHKGLFQLLFLLRGRVRATIDGATWHCEGPTVLTIHPSVVHGFVFSKAAQGYVLTLDQSVIFSSDPASHGERFAQLFVEPLQMRLAPGSEVATRLEALLEQMML
jgi:AraC family transcriptional activator of pobA